jgi:type II secretory pathway pseudopilin PulG
MVHKHKSAGFSLVELLVGIVVLLLAMAGLAGLLIKNARMNKIEQMTVEAQANARNCLSMVVQKLRSAGWDPLNVGINVVTLDPDLTDQISQIEVFADYNPEDGDSDDPGEQVLIRHTGNRVEWRQTASSSYETLAINISNDADGNGTPEPMFVPDSTTNPTRITVTITAQSPVPDARTGDFIRYTVTSDVVLRGS